MNISFADGMSRAAELTRAGKLEEATALIQSLLRGTPAPAAPQPPHVARDLARDDASADVIEGSFTRLDETAPHSEPRAARQPRNTLRETLATAAAQGLPHRGTTAPVAPDLPKGAQFLSLTHRSTHGSRAYRLYVPARIPDGRMPLVVMLHGCTQSPEDFAVGTGMNALAEEFGCLIAWPAQPQGANAQKCWNWFRPEDQGRDRGEPALIAGIVRDILRDHPADPARVYVAGLSAGGAAAAIMGAAYPDLFAAVGVHSGLPVGGAQDMVTAFAAMRSGAAGKSHAAPVPTIVFHGAADATVHPANGAAVIAQAVQAHSGVERTHVSGVGNGGRTYQQTSHATGDGRSIAEHWEIDGAGHAWSGGQPGGSFTDPKGPDASREMLRFFLQHRR